MFSHAETALIFFDLQAKHAGLIPKVISLFKHPIKTLGGVALKFSL